MISPKHNLAEVVRHFQIEGRFLGAVPYGSGHINDTFAGRFERGDRVVRYIHQRINHSIFRQPALLMENIERVTSFARQKIEERGGDVLRETLNLIPTRDGGCFHRTEEGDYWRTYVFIEGAKTYDRVEDLRHVYSASKAFGAFQKLLAELPPPRLHETIPNFHHTPSRFQAFGAALEADACNRAAEVKDEIAFVLAREAETAVVTRMIESGEIPERVTHNDTKLNNVMIDDATGEGVCVIDLDTVMPGSALYDFGDSVRIGASTALEDERDLDKVGVDLDLLRRLTGGYLESAREFLTGTELDYLPFSAKLMTLECGLRFLTDHLQGDTYFKVHREGHNLDRARTQFKMVAEMEAKMAEMERIVAESR